MKIETLKDLEALVKMCNKHGIGDISVDGISMRLNGAPDLKTEQTSGSDKIATPDEFTPEQILMWSSGQTDI